jgi:hypothetical protein
MSVSGEAFRTGLGDTGEPVFGGPSGCGVGANGNRCVTFGAETDPTVTVDGEESGLPSLTAASKAPFVGCAWG